MTRLVCFPGQGWAVSNRSTGEMSLDPKNGEIISYSSMVVERGDSRQLLIYWFQAYDRTNPDTFSQKLATLWNKVSGVGQDNAFVRISTSLNGTSADEARETIFRFIRAFYPVFLDYVRDGNGKEQLNG